MNQAKVFAKNGLGVSWIKLPRNFTYLVLHLVRPVASFVYTVDVDRLRSLDSPHSTVLTKVVADSVWSEFAYDPFPIFGAEGGGGKGGDLVEEGVPDGEPGGRDVPSTGMA